MSTEDLLGQEKSSHATPEVNESRGSWYALDWSLLPVKGCYLFLNMKDSAYIPYLILFLTSVGLNLTEAGIISGARLVCMVIGSPVWGLIDDRWNRPTLLIPILCFTSSTLMVAQPFVAAQISKLNATCSATMGPNVDLLARSRLHNSTEGSNAMLQDCASNRKLQLLVHLIMCLLMTWFDGALVGLNDSAVIRKIQSSNRKINFGRQRLFGAIGFGAGALVTTLLLHPFSVAFPSMSKYSPAFFVYSFCTISYVICCVFLFNQKGMREKKKSGNGVGRLRVVWKTVRQFPVAFFLASAVVAGAANGVQLGFTFQLLEDLHASKVITGLTFVVCSLSCIVLFPVMTKLLVLLGGAMQGMGVATLAYSARFILYAYLRIPYIILIIQVVDSLCFALFITGAVVHTRSVSPKEILSTMFTIMNALFFGAGSMVANLLGGYMYQELGGQTMFRAASSLTFVWSGFILVYVLMNRKDRFFGQKIEFEDAVAQSEEGSCPAKEHGIQCSLNDN